LKQKNPPDREAQGIAAIWSRKLDYSGCRIKQPPIVNPTPSKTPKILPPPTAPRIVGIPNSTAKKPKRKYSKSIGHSDSITHL